MGTSRTSTRAGTDSLAAVANGIAELLGSGVPDAREIVISDVARVFGGNARRAWGATAAWRDAGGARTEPLILLVRQKGSQVSTDPRWEHAVLHGLAEQGVRAPRLWGHDPDGHLFGRPSVLLQRLPGSADPVAYLNADAATGRARTLDLARAAAELHAARTDLSEPVASADDLGGPAGQLAHWHGQFRSARLEPHPALGWIFDWLADHHLAPQRPVLVHGDFRVGNVLYAGDRITGLLDWELAHVGDRAEDLAWAYRALWSPRRFCPLPDFLQAYTEAGGEAVDPDALLWHRVFAEAKFAAISLQAARAVVDGTSTNLRLIDRTRTVVPSVERALAWIRAADRAGTPC